MVQPGKQLGSILFKIHMQLPYGLANMLLGIYPRKIKIYVYMKTYTQMSIVILFIKAKSWK